MKNVLFLCTGNSCRSQIAEALVNNKLGSRWSASSAGTSPSGYVHPLAIRALNEIGISHTGASKHLNNFRHTDFDLVITVCADAEEKCPLWLGSGHKTHIGFDDPATATGTDEEKMAVFRRVRNEIEEKIIPLIEKHSKID